MRVLVGLLLLLINVEAYIPVYVMLPLETLNNDGSFNNKLPWDNWFQGLAQAGTSLPQYLKTKF